jgi:ribosomal protein S16
VAPKGVEIQEEIPDDDTNVVEPEVAEPEAQYSEDGIDDVEAPEEVSPADSTQAEVIDFLEFAETHPNAKFKFMRNGKEIEIDAKKAAAILGQGAAISEDARQLKIQKAEFDEYLSNKKAETDGLMLAMEFTVRPQLQKAYDEVIKVQQYQNTFRQQLAQTQDPVQQAQIQANMQQNDRYLQQIGQTINRLKPNLEQFYQLRSNQVREILDSNRKGFQDKELRNAAIYDEVREKVSKGWQAAKNQLVPGVDNLDLVTSDEHILSLIRDGLKYRDRPKAKSAGNSIAALTTRKTAGSINAGSQKNQVENLREQDKRGDTKAADNLLVAQLAALRAQRR